MNNKFIIIAGYGWSGSSALVDALSEFENVSVPNVEFRLIKDPYGLSDLRHAMVGNWDHIRSNAAITNFLWLCKKCNKKQTSRFSSFGLDYSRLLCSDFMTKTDLFINELVDFNYRGINYHENFKKRHFEFLIGRIFNSIRDRSRGRIDIDLASRELRYAHPTQRDFDSHTKKYLASLFTNYGDKIIILDQAVSPLDTISLQHFFDDAKMIIVDRDPRDIYIDMIEHASLIGTELKRSHDVNKYIKWHKSLRPNVLSENMLNIRFEDLVNDREGTVKRILGFLEWDLGAWTKKNESFKPIESRQNIGLWDQPKYSKFKNEIEKIMELM